MGGYDAPIQVSYFFLVTCQKELLSENFVYIAPELNYRVDF